MTTNVYDIRAGLLTCDSRWSVEEGDLLMYVDDTGYNKIIFDDQLALIFAGDMRNIEIWKQWFMTMRDTLAPMDHVEQTSIILVDMKDGSLQFESDYILWSKTDEQQIEACYAGTGAPYAQDCWSVNKCALTAVASAKAEDFYSGGNVLSLNRHTSETTATDSASYSDVNIQAKDRGLIMNMKTNSQPVRVADAAANDSLAPEVKALAQRVLNGKAVFSAPFPGMSQPWTNEKKEELAKTLARYPRTK